MNICILTYPLHSNFGFIMQAFALQKVLTDMGHQVVTVNLWEKRPSLLGKIRYHILFYLKRIIHPQDRTQKKMYFPKRSEIEYLNSNTWAFFQKHIRLTSLVSNERDLKDIGRKYEVYIVGSDQVWRKEYVRNITRFFLDFVQPLKRKVSYAASFGTNNINLTLKEHSKCKELLKSFNAVSVREKDGVKICESNFGITPALVIDPTLLLKKKDYEMLIDLQDSVEKLNCNKSCLAYILTPTEEKTRYLKIIAKKLNLKIVNPLPKSYEGGGIELMKDCVFPSISAWLQMFLNADLILTDSFHGTVFSIIFEKNFLTFDNVSRGSSRLTSLLDMLGLRNRLIHDLTSTGISVLDYDIDYQSVNIKLEQFREESLIFLRNAIEE